MPAAHCALITIRGNFWTNWVSRNSAWAQRRTRGFAPLRESQLTPGKRQLNLLGTRAVQDHFIKNIYTELL
jgi:hypothetical protein